MTAVVFGSPASWAVGRAGGEPWWVTFWARAR